MADRSRERSASRSRSRSRDPVAEGEVVPATDAVKSEEVQDATNGEVNDAGAVDNNNAGDGDGSMDAAPVEIYIGNLDFNTRDQDLEDEFRKEVPNLIEARVVMDKFDTRRSRGFAFAKVATQEEADKLIAKYNEFELGGRTIRVNIATQGPNLDANHKFLMSLTTQQLGLAKKISENYVPEIFKDRSVKKDQLKCRMCNNQAIGRIDCEKWFSKNQRNKARKDNGCIATCINCTNGGNQGQSGGDRSLNQPRPYQNAVKCSQCHRIANGTQQMESYFSKKQRSKSKQGKSCVCIGCTTKNNKQWGH